MHTVIYITFNILIGGINVNNLLKFNALKYKNYDKLTTVAGKLNWILWLLLPNPNINFYHTAFPIKFN